MVEGRLHAAPRLVSEPVRIQHVDDAGEGGQPHHLLLELVQLAVIQDAHGYLADTILEPDGTIRLREHNCAIYHIAKGEPSACEAELDLFRDILGADVVRETHIASGDRCCTYRIVPAD